MRVQLLGATRLTRVAVHYLLERRQARIVAIDPGEEHESEPWFAPVRGLAVDNGIPLGRRDADLVLDLDPGARPLVGEGPMLRVLPPRGARSPDVNRMLLQPGDWEIGVVNAAGTHTWASKPLDRVGDAEDLLEQATLRAVEALDAGWERLVAGEPGDPLPRPLVAGRFRAQEAFVVWQQPAEAIAARIRACAGPWGGARTHVGDGAVFLLDARVVRDETPKDYDPGTIITLDDGVEIATGRGVVRVERLRPGWRPVRRAGDYLREVGLSGGYQLS